MDKSHELRQEFEQALALARCQFFQTYLASEDSEVMFNYLK